MEIEFRVRSRTETVDDAQFHYHHSVRGMSIVERLTSETPDHPSVVGFLHRPETAPRDALVLTHGAGSNCNAPLLWAVADALSSAGTLVLRCDLPFRQARPHGPPFGNGAQDRAGLLRAVEVLRELGLREGTPVRVSLGGHSYGGRQASMVVAEDASIVDALLLLSYPLHPPDKPQQLRTAHFAKLHTPALFVHGSRDPFGSLDEMRAALSLIPSHTDLVAIENAGHDLAHGRHDVAGRTLAAWTEFVKPSRKHGDPAP
jgi:predicted alpha/beta-hydrolase family hydrolase